MYQLRLNGRKLQFDFDHTRIARRSAQLRMMAKFWPWAIEDSGYLI